MNAKQLMLLSENNEVRVDSFRNHRATIPYYYNSLRHAFSFYFNTFITNNTAYSFYAEGLYNKNVQIFKHQIMDHDNTLLSIISFQRFFELYIKDLLSKANKNLILKPKQRLNSIDIINSIQNGTFQPKTFNNNPLSISFSEAISMLYFLIDLSKKKSSSGRTVKKFSKLINNYSFLDSAEYRSTLEYINWYRNRVLHNGNKLPSLWLFDYIISQRISPIIWDIVKLAPAELVDAFFYLKTVTGIDLLKELNKIKFEFKTLKNKKNQQETFVNLLKIGHIKELGRANMNMNLFLRLNHATYEYNYNDPAGRAMRFALSEDHFEDFRNVSDCPCCGINSLVLYQKNIDDLFNPGHDLKISWVKCYMCDYYLRFDTGEPYLLGLYTKSLFAG
ncbi:MAG: hypothetical protein JWO92_1135 [Chitinophagaceae bacterium]|nr:hypothetical protein [Chitinophagaceae bacterium]